MNGPTDEEKVNSSSSLSGGCAHERNIYTWVIRSAINRLVIQRTKLESRELMG